MSETLTWGDHVNYISTKGVKDVISLLDTKNFERLSVPSRKSVETPVVVVSVGRNVLCYILHENSWRKLGEIPFAFTRPGNFVPCGGQLYRTLQYTSNSRPHSLNQVTYNSYSNSYTQSPWEEGRYLRKAFRRDVSKEEKEWFAHSSK